MGIVLKSLALVALVVSFAGSAYAGICNKKHPNWDAKTKMCPEKPVTLKKREPPPSPPKVSEPPVVPTAREEAPPQALPPRSSPTLMTSFLPGVSTPSEVRSPHLPPLTVVACGKATTVGGVIGTTFVSQTTSVWSFGRISN